MIRSTNSNGSSNGRALLQLLPYTFRDHCSLDFIAYSTQIGGKCSSLESQVSVDAIVNISCHLHSNLLLEGALLIAN